MTKSSILIKFPRKWSWCIRLEKTFWSCEKYVNKQIRLNSQVRRHRRPAVLLCYNPDEKRHLRTIHRRRDMHKMKESGREMRMLLLLESSSFDVNYLHVCCFRHPPLGDSPRRFTSSERTCTLPYTCLRRGWAPEKQKWKTNFKNWKTKG